VGERQQQQSFKGGDEMIGFRWRSWLGASAILFLLYGAIDMVSAIAVPITGIHGGAGATSLVLDPSSDAYLVGGKQVIERLRSTNPKLDTLLVSSMVSMCAQLMAFAILAILVTWVAIRRGQAWGLWAVTAAALVQVPYYAVITSMYAAQGAPLGGAVSLLPFVVGPFIALAFGLIGMRRMRRARQVDSSTSRIG
jgi:hypothetical protein